jgi:hypothetical protein
LPTRLPFLNTYPSISTTNVEHGHPVGKGYGGIVEEAADGASKRAEEEIIHTSEYALNRPACLPSALREERAEETQDPEHQVMLFRAPIARRTLPLPLRSVGGDPAGVKERRR